ncbi:NAC domain-containing protein 19 [Morus notabilis]|uniref:NAC domain-containing protein 19 n=1 Tax=Morus notabilis TaxID=981085 RepID=W9S697_9ROSA|nr:NAC domain-containing protein 19 [Morus notabilis]EXC28187.1 NAC domain-containing protein 19 [Morus notabilis]
MGDANATSFPLPPGVRFHPSDEELLRHYLSGKNAEPGGARAEGNNLIGELDLYGYDPFELPNSACYAYGCGGKKRHWFCYTGGGAVRERGGKRRARSGFWRRKGRMRIVMGQGGRGDLGTRTKFVFYLGNSAKTAFRTNWVLYEYAPIDHLKASFVLCRVFNKSCPRNSISENGLVSCAEESFSAVRHIGIQHDGDNISSRNDDIEVDDQIATRPAPMASIQVPLCSEPNTQMNIDAFTDDHLLAILNEDFLELDDLNR